MADNDCLKIEQVQAMTGFKRSTIYKHLRLRQFPQPIRLGRAVRWRRQTILDWMQRQESAAAKLDSQARKLAEV